MKKIFKKIGIVILSIAVLALTIGLTQSINKGAAADGYMQVKLYDINGELVKTKKVGFEKEQTMIFILKNNFDLEYEESGYGAFIISIDKLDSRSGETLFLSLEVNGEVSLVGISSLVPEDGMMIAFRLTDWMNG